MFEKKEDRLFDYAFGELDARELQAFEASLLHDEEAQTEVELLRTMKADLESFREVPEMQFSKERLRAAILEQGLKPKKTGLPWLNWVLVPTAAACVFALGSILMNGSGTKPTRYISSGPNMAMLSQEPNKGFNPNVSTSPKNFDVQVPTSQPTNTVSVKQGSVSGTVRNQGLSHIVRHHVRTHRSTNTQHIETSNSSLVAFERKDSALPGEEPKATLMDYALKSSTGVELSNAIMADASGSDAMKVAFGDSHPTTSQDSKLIEINRDEDSGVGAAVATEVNNTANVVIGG